MPFVVRHFVVLAVAVMACGLGGCASINASLANGAGDYIPHWMGGLPPDSPPRPGSPQYDAYVKEREQRRLEPAPAKAKAAGPEAAQPEAAPSSAPATSSLDAVH